MTKREELVANPDHIRVLNHLVAVMKSSRDKGVSMAIWGSDIESVEWAVERLSSRDNGEADKRTAPASCPNCYNESDCSNVDICNAVEEVYRPSEAPSTIPADAVGERLSQLAADIVVSGWMAGDHGIERAKKEAEDKLLAFACDEIERHMARQAASADVLAMKEALRLLAAEDERQAQLHDILETIREQIRLEVPPEHRPDGLFKNIQDAVYAMRGRTPLMNDAAITAAISSIDVPGKTAGDSSADERDPYGNAEQWGMQYVLRLFGKHIAGVESWAGGDGSESVDGDVLAEFDNIAKAAGWVNADGDTVFGPAPAEEQGAAVKVKPLEWRDHRPDSFPEPAWSAETPFGFYHIEEVSASDSPAYVVRLHAHHFIADKDGLDDAKAAAQADYETRIKSAFDIETQGVAVSADDLVNFIKDKAYTTFDDWEDDFARALLDKYSIRSALMTEGK